MRTDRRRFGALADLSVPGPEQPSPEVLELRAIRALLEQLVSNRGLPDQDPVDVALVAGLDFLKDRETFRAQSLIDHGDRDSAFKALLLAADIETAADMGYWLRRHRGRVLNGRRLECSDHDRDGAVWAFVTM